MLSLNFERRGAGPLRALCLGAHSDDIEIGCGGTILKLTQAVPDAAFRWVVFSSGRVREQEALQSADRFLHGSSAKATEIHGFRDGFFPSQGAEIKEVFERIKLEYEPDLIFTHYRHDLHQDHRLISELTWNTFRHHLILEYEVLKYDGDLGAPNLFVHLDEKLIERKVEHLVSSFPSQASRQWFSEESFRALACLRGVECAAPSKYAEAFYCRKIVLL